MQKNMNWGYNITRKLEKLINSPPFYTPQRKGHYGQS